ncbi:hypothetical protein GPECTOR_1960g1000 [Gonium pectorale]|uniref:Uncharacterized protein n=1 Tax=Gonium pectorale TaxID=33097 RepID=A0A150FUY3_GONPE|nr:hypothetical protein GPECTOR_1960g1000 [Gonium pectorale]|eukprot:KXZ40840.1 hypothetical protein GPECTOR_1960g1000 [Gonium pectorale]
MSAAASAAEPRGTAAWMGLSQPDGADLLEPADFTADGRRSLPPEAKFMVTPGKWLLCERSDMTPELQGRFISVVQKYANKGLFANTMADLGEYRGEVGPARLDLTHDRPIYQRPRPHSQEEYAAMDAACKELLGADIIEESRSSGYAMNSTMPPKRAADGSWTQRRFCQDARDLNAATVPDLHLSGGGGAAGWLGASRRPGARCARRYMSNWSVTRVQRFGDSNQ